MKNRKLDVETTIEMVKTEITDDPETVRIATEISNDCAEVTGKKAHKIRRRRKGAIIAIIFFVTIYNR